jgi:RimJ/RimL family protein N-acetyltransferase
MFEQLDNIDVDAVKLDGVTLRMGNRILKLVVDEDSPAEVEDQVREEFREKIASKLTVIKQNINDKVEEMSNFVNTLRNDYERKEIEIQKRLDNVIAMPDMRHDDIYSGLSVARGSYSNEYYWLVQGIYWPKYVDGRAIEHNYTKKMISHIIVCVITKGDKITGVSTRKPIGFDYFQHYHQSNPDCWGHWRYNKNLRGKNHAQEVLRIAQECQIVLESINTGSIATRNPRGLPRKDTLLRHLLPEGQGVDQMRNLRQDSRRIGVKPSGIEVDTAEIWGE